MNRRCPAGSPLVLIPLATRRVQIAGLSAEPDGRWVTQLMRNATGRAKRHGFEYYRHATLSLFAALNTQSGEVLARRCRGTPAPRLSTSSATS